MKIKPILLVVQFLFLFLSSQGQIGVSFFSNNENLNPIFQNQTGTDISIQSYGAGISYELKLKSYRVHFYPGLNYSQNLDEVNFGTSKFNQTNFGLTVPIRFYVLSMEADCNCPTFSQSSKFFSKGFFLELYTGINYSNNELLTTEIQTNSDLNYLVGLGIGLDIGLSDKASITFYGRTGRIINQSISDTYIGYEVEDKISNFTNFGIEMKYYFKDY